MANCSMHFARPFLVSRLSAGDSCWMVGWWLIVGGWLLVARRWRLVGRFANLLIGLTDGEMVGWLHAMPRKVLPNCCETHVKAFARPEHMRDAMAQKLLKDQHSSWCCFDYLDGELVKHED